MKRVHNDNYLGRRCQCPQLGRQHLNALCLLFVMFIHLLSFILLCRAPLSEESISPKDTPINKVKHLGIALDRWADSKGDDLSAANHVSL